MWVRREGRKDGSEHARACDAQRVPLPLTPTLTPTPSPAPNKRVPLSLSLSYNSTPTPTPNQATRSACLAATMVLLEKEGRKRQQARDTDLLSRNGNPV